ncbi:hypothetical protein [Polymorphospora lycopeni]|uniref:Uncharacterized protein n=1 Tax=Polymorphospora lycopeni TaxID=3140240 RepID=A0ABV5CUU0_9ACTN
MAWVEPKATSPGGREAGQHRTGPRREYGDPMVLLAGDLAGMSE